MVLDLYEVVGVLGEGGMGKVYKVRHRGWNVELAVKSARPEILARPGGADSFEREAEVWVKLGLHPHVASCYYVRRIAGVPRIFTEYVAGGSLAEWIHNRTLYAGGPQPALARILDVAIQFAWGLHFAHEQGLIHQDVKPANVLLTPDGLVKVTDFGLAKLGRASGPAVGDAALNILVSSGAGMTPAYCSPEQAAQMPLSRRTDIWSWAVSVLEMFTGEVTWPSGTVAPEALTAYLEDGPGMADCPHMPVGLAVLLKRCFQPNPAHRPAGMQDLVPGLQLLYRQAAGKGYWRDEPQAAAALADGLNNRGVSCLDLGKEQDAEQFFQEALRCDPQHVEATYNRGLLLWRTGRLAEELLLKSLEQLRQSHPARAEIKHLLGLVHLERADVATAIRCLDEAAQKLPGDPALQGALRTAREAGPMLPIQQDLATTQDELRSVCISGDGRLAAAVGRYGDACYLECWNLPRGTPVGRSAGHPHLMCSVHLGRDGQLAVAGTQDDTLVLWEPASGRCLDTLRGHKGAVSAVWLADDGKLALSGGADATLRLWDLDLRKCVRTWSDADGVHSVCLSGDAALALSSSGVTKGIVNLWDTRQGKCLRSFVGHEGAVLVVWLTPNGRWAISGGEDHLVRLWDTGTGRCLQTFTGHTGGVKAVALSSDGRFALSGSQDGTLRVWEAASGHCIRALAGHSPAFYGERSAYFSADGQTVVGIGLNRKQVICWRPFPAHQAAPALCRATASEAASSAEQEYQRRLEAARQLLATGNWAKAAESVRAIRASPERARDPQAFELWAALYRRLPRRTLQDSWHVADWPDHHGWVGGVSFSPDGKLAATGCPGGLQIWDMIRNTRLHQLDRCGEVYCLIFSPDSKLLLKAGGGHKTQLQLYDVTTGACVRTFAGITDSIGAASFTRDGRQLYSGGHDKRIQLWDIATGQSLRAVDGHTDWVYALRLTPDERRLLSASGDHTLRLWDVGTGKCLQVWTGHADAVDCVDISRDGKFALSGGGYRVDFALHLWDMATGQCIRTLDGHQATVRTVHFTRDGRFAVSGSHDRTVKIWDIASGKCLRTLEGHSDWVCGVALSADARWVLSGARDTDSAVKLWMLDWDLETRSC